MKRDPRFVDAARHKPTRPDEPFAKPKREICFRPKDFQIAADRTHAICPAGKRLYRNGRHRALNGYEAIRFRVYGLLLVCKASGLSTVGSIAHVYPVSVSCTEHGTMMGYPRADSQAESRVRDTLRGRRVLPAPVRPIRRQSDSFAIVGKSFEHVAAVAYLAAAAKLLS